MTWIHDGNGTKWVDVPQPKRKKPPRNIRFKDLKVGDQIMLPPKAGWHRGIPMYYIVTDMWFDPVAGQKDPLKGSMVGYAHINAKGEYSHKSSTPIRGLASQQFEYADIDYIELCKTRLAAFENKENIVGIGLGATIRARPKVPGSRF